MSQMLHCYHGNPPCLSLGDVGKMLMAQVESCCNKSVPIFLLPHPSVSRLDWMLLTSVLHDYLYRTWFRPYRSEIEFGQFLSQTFAIKENPPPPDVRKPADTADFIASMSRAICSHVEATQQIIGDRVSRVSSSAEMKALRGETGMGDWEAVRDQRFLVLQPLFRAVAIGIRSNDYSIDAPTIATIPAMVVLTGVREGLSASVTFEPIAPRIRAYHRVGDSVQAAETSLATAVQFVMDLEKRELAAFGPRPDPALAGQQRGPGLLVNSEDEILWFAKRHGWEGDEAPEGPSSTWVDMNIYPHWSGEGARCDAKQAQGWETMCRRRVLGGQKVSHV